VKEKKLMKRSGGPNANSLSLTLGRKKERGGGRGWNAQGGKKGDACDFASQGGEGEERGGRRKEA